MFHRLLAICQRKQAEDAPCSLLTSVLNRNLFKQINEHMDMLKIASYVASTPVPVPVPASVPPSLLAPFWHNGSSHNQQQYMFVSSIEEDNASAAAATAAATTTTASLFMPFFTLSSLSADGECAGAGAGAGGNSSDSSDNSDDFGYFEDEESFA
jgi:hypothetical protein